MRRSLNFVLVSWANRGVNLWTVHEFTQTMPQGVAQYFVDPQVIDVLPDSVTIRQYLMGSPVNVTPDFTTVNGSASVTVSGLGATPSAGQYITVGVMVSVGGLIIDGFYLVDSVPGSGQATITAASSATASETGGAVPEFVTSAASSTVTVNLPDHGLSVGQPFVVEVTVNVGGLALLGPYAVATVASADQITFTAPYPAGSTQTVSENSGQTQLSTQSTAGGIIQAASPVDINMYPLSRSDYNSIPLKDTQGRPTSIWIDRQRSPIINVWPTPDANGPYEIHYWASRQVEDADITGSQTLAVPYRMLETFTADLSVHLSFKFAPDRTKDLAAYAIAQWESASVEDTEKVSTFMTPDFDSYFT